MEQRIVDALRAHPGIHDWTLRLERTRGVQIYLAGPDIESVRQVARGNPNLRLQFTEHGGHVGFLSGSLPFRAVHWGEDRVMDFFDSHSGSRAD